MLFLSGNESKADARRIRSLKLVSFLFAAG
jgi:hypothetical protein